MDDAQPQPARQMPGRRYPHLSQWVVGIAVILFSTAGIAAIIGWRSSAGSPEGGIKAPVSAADSVKAVAFAASTGQKRAAAKARALGKCAECGLIESIGDINERRDEYVVGTGDSLSAADRNGQSMQSTAQSAMVVRMADGSRRVISHANPALWRLGERVVIIAGSTPPQQ